MNGTLKFFVEVETGRTDQRVWLKHRTVHQIYTSRDECENLTHQFLSRNKHLPIVRVLFEAKEDIDVRSINKARKD